MPRAKTETIEIPVTIDTTGYLEWRATHGCVHIGTWPETWDGSALVRGKETYDGFVYVDFIHRIPGNSDPFLGAFIPVQFVKE